MTRQDCNTSMFLGVTPEEVAACIKDEMDTHEGLDVDEVGSMTIEPFIITKAEIANMGDFEGW
ncbi:MAG: hypothetical protein ACW99G_19590 [Candidatus Thorarchaeota archaeon]